MRSLCAVLLAALLAGCAPSAQESLADARSQLADASYADAVASAEAGLAAGPDAVTAWGLELALLEARARDGRGAAALAQLERLAEVHPERLPPTQYSAVAYQLRTGGDGPAAIQVLDLGVKRFPGDPNLERLIADSKTAPGVDAAELQMLKSLGYIE